MGLEKVGPISMYFHFIITPLETLQLRASLNEQVSESPMKLNIILIKYSIVDTLSIDFKDFLYIEKCI